MAKQPTQDNPPNSTERAQDQLIGDMQKLREEKEQFEREKLEFRALQTAQRTEVDRKAALAAKTPSQEEAERKRRQEIVLKNLAQSQNVKERMSREGWSTVIGSKVLGAAYTQSVRDDDTGKYIVIYADANGEHMPNADKFNPRAEDSQLGSKEAARAAGETVE